MKNQTIGVLCGLGIILALIQTCIWHSRAGKQIIDLGTIGKFLLYIIHIVGTIFFIVMVGVSLWWLIFFKRPGSAFLVIPTSIQQTSFTVLVVVTFILKSLDILHIIIRQSNIDIFFMDWEKPKSNDITDVSVWRTYFVANEYSELQTFRRVNSTFHIIAVLFFLKVINLENVATAQPGTNLFPSSSNYNADYNGILRVGIAFSMWLATALVQYLVYVIFYQRFVEDRIINFIDLCSVSNIKRESQANSGRRGLETNSDDQIFIIKVDRPVRSQYDLLLRSYQHRILTRVNKKIEERESEILLVSYRGLNEFLCAFINRSLPTYPYTIRHRNLFENLLNCEFRTANTSELLDHTESLFLIDHDRNFSKTIFAGYENSLFIWNTATFLFVDYFASNYVLAAIITYLLNLIAVQIRQSLGQQNLAKKTLIPKSFLI
ncbi:unnamed protein product [Rotaria sp. Silwood1]|nr:unnamed protein product [Rotaria sp. Silwood1]